MVLECSIYFEAWTVLSTGNELSPSTGKPQTHFHLPDCKFVQENSLLAVSLVRRGNATRKEIPISLLTGTTAQLTQMARRIVWLKLIGW